MRKILILLLLLGNICIGQYRSLPSYEPIRTYSGQRIWDIVNVPEEKIDVGLWALIIANEYDPNIDINTYLKTLDDMSAEITRMLAGRQSDLEVLLAVRMFQYDEGIWNENYPFQYDLDDPFGTNLDNKLLSTYIDTRMGNCVSMPSLFIALMERVDPNIPFFGVNAPQHLFCRLNNRQTGEIWNVEATNGGNPARDQWYIETMKINQHSIDSGLYLSTLTKKEFVADLIAILVSKYRDQKDYKRAMEYAELILKVNPKSGVGLVQKGALSSWLAYETLKAAKSEQRELTEEEKQEFRKQNLDSKKYIDSAMAMGWRPESQELKDIYINTIEEEQYK